VNLKGTKFITNNLSINVKA